jgi:multidrug efflux pump subunit AcrA (membrane-fusion protein)
MISILLLATAAIGQDRPTQFEATQGDPVLEYCTVKAKRELLLPANDNGALVSLDVELGDVVPEGAIIGQIDDNEAKAAVAVAKAELETANENAGRGSEIQIKYAVEAANLADVEYKKLKELQKTKSVSDWDVERGELEWKRAEAQVNVRQLEKVLAGYEVGGKDAAYTAAKNALERRSLTAKFGGIVVEKYRRAGEWVQAGEPVLRLMNFETMVVSGKVDATRFHRHELEKRPVTVEIDLPNNQKAEFQGQITFVNSIVDGQNREISVEAEVENRQVGGHWLLPHAVFARMRIHMN